METFPLLQLLYQNNKYFSISRRENVKCLHSLLKFLVKNLVKFLKQKLTNYPHIHNNFPNFLKFQTRKNFELLIQIKNLVTIKILREFNFLEKSKFIFEDSYSLF